MGFLPPAVAITTMRATIARSFDKTITRRRKTFVPDDSGGSTETITETTYSGRVVPRPVVSDERLQAGRLVAEMVVVVYLPWNADVIPSDVLVLEDGAELQVTDDNDIQSTLLKLIVNCYRVT
jgi:hypothetical protein